MSPGAGLSRRGLLHGAVAASVAVALPARAGAEDVADQRAREAMARAATRFLDALDARARRRASFALADAERANWHYVPRSREGVPFKAMPAGARAAAHELLQAGLSPAGYTKVTTVIRLEEVLRQLERFGLFRDPENYALSIFGTPGPGAAWGWRLEGHHLSLNFTLVPGRALSATPLFLGANPATVPAGAALAGQRALAAEEDLGLALARSLVQARGEAVRARLVIAADAPGDIVTGPGREESLKAPVGIPLGEMGDEQRGLAVRLLETYARNLRAETADAELARIRSAGLEPIHFAWAGPIELGRPHYFRLHGPAVLIELDNTQNAANHIHSVWHDPRNDFGRDALRAHYRDGHHHHA